MQTVIAMVNVPVLLVTLENNVTHVTPPIIMALSQIVKVLNEFTVGLTKQS